MGHHSSHRESPKDVGNCEDVERSHIEPLSNLIAGDLLALQAAKEVLRVCHQLLRRKWSRRGSPSLLGVL